MVRKLGRCPECKGKFQVPVTWGDKGLCIDCYVGSWFTTLTPPSNTKPEDTSESN